MCLCEELSVVLNKMLEQSLKQVKPYLEVEVDVWEPDLERFDMLEGVVMLNREGVRGFECKIVPRRNLELGMKAREV